MGDFTFMESDAYRAIQNEIAHRISDESRKRAYETQERLKKEREERERELDKKWHSLSVYEKMAYDYPRYQREKSSK